MKNTSPSSNHLNMARFAVRSSVFAVAAIGIGLASPAAFAAGTVAGTDIVNTATASYSDGTTTTTVNSNTSTIKVDEVLDVVVAGTDPGDVPTSPGATSNVQTYLVTNTGNGDETFSLTATVTAGGDDFNPVLTKIVLDTNGNGQYDPGVDEDYVPGTNDPTLSPDTSPTGSSITVFVITSTPGTVTDGQRAQVDLRAVAQTGSGTPGTTFTGAGQGGGNAVVGNSGADEQDSGFLVVSAASVVLTKTATVSHPTLGSRPVPGATITYTLTATTSGSGTVNGLVIADAIPVGTDYVASSITLGSVGKTDAADADEANYNGTQISVNAGNVPGGQTRVVTFQVIIE